MAVPATVSRFQHSSGIYAALTALEHKQSPLKRRWVVKKNFAGLSSNIRQSEPQLWGVARLAEFQNLRH